MKITKKEDHYLLQNEFGEYHMSHEQFDLIGEYAARKKASSEIKIKHESGRYQFKEINFEQARSLGFCEYGIEDFCEQLNLDINKTYRIEDLNKLLTLDILKEYPDECIKLFGDSTLKYLGGVKGVLNEDTINLVLRPEFIPEQTLHMLSVKFAYSCLENFEKEYPDDDRPRKATEAKEAWIRGEITDVQLKAAGSAAESAARSAAGSAAWSAAGSAWSAGSAAWSAARKQQIKMILEAINE